MRSALRHLTRLEPRAHGASQRPARGLRASSGAQALRAQEDPAVFYFGMFHASVDSSGYSGLGYIGATGYEALSAASAVGFDSTYLSAAVDPLGLHLPVWALSMLHEVGHNHSLQHAPCGTSSGVDPAYPYPGGVLNPAMPVYDSL